MKLCHSTSHGGVKTNYKRMSYKCQPVDISIGRNNKVMIYMSKSRIDEIDCTKLPNNDNN